MRGFSFIALVAVSVLAVCSVHGQPVEPKAPDQVPAVRPRREGDGPAPRRGFLLPAGVKQIKDITYATIPATKDIAEIYLKLDLYVPETSGEAEQPRPLVIWIHGGGWQGGDKERCPGAGFVNEGFIVASIEYRLTDVAQWPAQIHDCKAAVRFLRDSAKRYDIDPDRIGVWGASAGGQLVAMLGETNGDPAMEGMVGNHLKASSSVQAVCDWFGPADLVKLAGDALRKPEDGKPGPLTKLVGGPIEAKQAELKDASPISHVSHDDVPILIMHGQDDNLVPVEQSKMLKAAFDKAGVKAELEILPDSGHGTGNFMRLATLSKVRKFFEEQLSPKVQPVKK